MFQTTRAAQRAGSRGVPPIQEGCAIGEAARASGVSAKMLRYYEAIGLVRPSARSAANYRSYNATAIRTLRFVGRARALGFSMDMIRRLLILWQDGNRSSAAVKALALQHVAELDARIAALQAMKLAISRVAGQCHGDHRPDCPILDEMAGSFPVLSKADRP
jgi:MerR family copper efflux transcriptional regulator